MVDLLTDEGVRQVLEYFHAQDKPTALICHGPISLLAAMDNSEEFVNGLRAGGQVAAKNWIYAGYQMAIFSTAEEEVAEAHQLGGDVLYYPDAALKVAGGSMSIAALWQSNAIRDRELITGQNPFSDEALAKLLIQALSERKR